MFEVRLLKEKPFAFSRKYLMILQIVHGFGSKFATKRSMSRAPEVEELISYDISGKSFNLQKAPTNYIPRESAEIRNVLEVLT